MRPIRPPVSSLASGEAGSVRFVTATNLVRQQPLSPRRFERGPEQIVSGDLRLPAGNERVPAVILLHGCGGLNPLPPREARWASLLRGQDYATLLLDSFSERGIAEVCTTPSQLNQVQRVPDVYGALRVLATHPRVDPERIFVMGWSHGGGVALEAATAWAARTFGEQGGPRLRGAVAFYPNCNIDAPERREVSVPVRVHAGEQDDATLAEPCVRYVASLRQRGADAEIMVHSGAQQ